MAVLALNGKAIDWAKPPKQTQLVKWDRRDQYGREVIGSLRAISHLDATDALAVKKFGQHIIILQPSYNTGVAASAGTHDYDACFDVYIPGVSWAEQQKFFRANGWGAYWRRPPKFGHHIHMFSLPPQEGKDRSDDYKSAGFKVGRFVDGGWSTRGFKNASAQIEAYYGKRDALASNARDNSWFPSSIKATIFDFAAYAKARKPKPKPAKPAKPSKPVLAWENVSFHNTHWNSVEGGKEANVLKTAPVIARKSAAGLPGVAAFAEVRSGQRAILVAEMVKYGYVQVAYEKANMLLVMRRPQVERIAYSFYKFSQQDGGNVEGVLRVKFRSKGSRFNIGVVHLDHDSSDAKKRSNLKEAVEMMERYGKSTLLPDWKSRSLLIGDFNKSVAFVGKVLEPLGFKNFDIPGATLDQAWVGSKRVTRGAVATEAPGDHPRIVVRLGKTV